MNGPLPAGRSYLDHASTSPLRPAARAAMVEALGVVGDPGRIHAEGLTARVAVEQAREQVAGLVGARPREVVLTSGATEAIAAACWGAAQRGRHQVVPAVEHSAVRLAAERHGEVTTVPVDGGGRVDVDDLLAAVRDDTAVVHLQWGNHEVGTTQPVAEAVAACRERGVLVHVDAAQAVGHVPMAFDDLGADLLSFSGHKFGAPAGTGGLLVRRGLRLAPLLVGGDQERARRAGLENVAAVAGLGAACDTLAADGGAAIAAEAAAQRALTDRIVDELTGTAAARPAPGASGTEAAVDAGAGDRRASMSAGATTSGRAADGSRLSPSSLRLVRYGDPVRRLPHIACFGVEGVEPQAVLLGLDRAGVAAHSGSACSSESLEPSPVLEAMGVDAHHSLRISVGWSTTDVDVDRLLATLPGVLADLRALSPGTMAT